MFNTITNQLNNSDILLISPKYHSIWWGLLEICSFKSQCHIDVSIESSMTVSWIGEQVMSLSQVGKHISLVNYVSWVKEHLSLRICVSGLGLEVNFSVHLQIFAGKIFPLATSETTSKFFPFALDKWMTLTHKCLLVDISFTCRLSKSLAFCGR